ncbi:uncharacterized protein UDID_19447 [Ustilago sp. UG-2017a]|nr:uncharacterized protein UDID_19447 [Ustilago sp. UG-2017a]
MTDPDLNSKLDRLLALMEAQLELSRQSQQEERLQRAHLSGEETIEPSHSEDQDQAGGGDESMLGDSNTPTPAPRPQRSISFNLNEHDETNYEKYASPTGPKYLKTRVDPYSRSQMDSHAQDCHRTACAGNLTEKCMNKTDVMNLGEICGKQDLAADSAEISDKDVCMTIHMQDGLSSRTKGPSPTGPRTQALRGTEHSDTRSVTTQGHTG